MAALHLTKENFEQEVVKSTIPVLVDFWAEWCGPCRVVGPIVDQLADELKGKLKVAKIDIDENQELAGKFNVMSIPTLIIFKGGAPVEQMVGAMPKDQLLKKINPHL